MLKKKGSTLFLRAAVIALGLVVLALCIFALPSMWWSADNDPEYSSVAFAFHAILVTMYIAAVPFFYALYQALKLLQYIDDNKAFSMLSVTVLKRIAYCAVAIAVVYTACSPFAYIWSQHEDAPGGIIFGMMPVGTSLVIAVFAGLLQRLLCEAIAIKAENDLTV